MQRVSQVRTWLSFPMLMKFKEKLRVLLKKITSDGEEKMEKQMTLGVKQNLF